MVEHQTTHQAAVSKAALDQIESNASWDKYAKAAGKRLQNVLPIVHQGNRSGELVLQYQSTSYALSDWTSGDLWRSLYETREGVQLIQSGYNNTSLSFDDLIALVGDTAAKMSHAIDVDVSRLERTSRLALETKDFVARATMAELMARADLVMPASDGSEYNLDTIITDLVSPLARDLLANGYIDENFTLYCSDYHAVAISVSAMNFILHCVQSDRADHRFRFDEAASIDAVVNEMGVRFLDGESVFNLDVFNHYLPAQPQLLDKALDKLAMRGGSDSAFIDAYLIDGTARELLISHLAPRWKGIFVYLAERSPLEVAGKVALVDVAAINAAPDLDYESSDRAAEFFSDHHAQMRAFVGAAEASKAGDLAILLRRLGAQVGDLTVLGDEQRKAIATAGLYPVTRANLSSTLGADTKLSLDHVKAANAHVYKHILDNLDEYLEVLSEDEMTVEAPDEFVAVLADVAVVSNAAVLPIAEGASESCEVADLEELDDVAWTAVVSAGRFATTVRNVSQFVGTFGVNEELIEKLAELELIDAEEVEEDARYDLAYALTEAEKLDPTAKVRLVGQLRLPNRLDPERLNDIGLTLLPALLASDLVPDAAETYALVSARPFAFREDYFEASKDLASYVSELPLSDDDLIQVMRSKRVAPDVKRAIADDLEFVSGRLSRQGAIAICEWAGMGNIVSVDLLIKLNEAGAPAEHILVVLEPHLSVIELSVLDQILLTLGDEYEPLTRVGHHRPRLKDRSGTQELLDELKRRNRVSSYSSGLLGGFRINMRH
jgi:hypothetical protein